MKFCLILFICGFRLRLWICRLYKIRNRWNWSWVQSAFWTAPKWIYSTRTPAATMQRRRLIPGVHRGIGSAYERTDEMARLAGLSNIIWTRFWGNIRQYCCVIGFCRATAQLQADALHYFRLLPQKSATPREWIFPSGEIEWCRRASCPSKREMMPGAKIRPVERVRIILLRPTIYLRAG